MTTKKTTPSSAVVAKTPATPTATTGTTAPATGAPVVAPKGFRLELQQMLQGWQAAIPVGGALQQAGGTLTQATVVAQLGQYLGAYTGLDAATLAETNSRTAVKGQLTAARAYYAQLKQALVGYYGATSPQLVQFGLKPRAQAKPLNAEQNAAKVARMRNTRDMRGTMGKREKLNVKSGPVTVTTAPTAPPSGQSAPAQAEAMATPAAAVPAGTQVK